MAIRIEWPLLPSRLRKAQQAASEVQGVIVAGTRRWPPSRRVWGWASICGLQLHCTGRMLTARLHQRPGECDQLNVVVRQQLHMRATDAGIASERVFATSTAKLQHEPTPAMVKTDATSACATRKVHGKAKRKYIDESDEEEA